MKWKNFWSVITRRRLKPRLCTGFYVPQVENVTPEMLEKEGIVMLERWRKMVNEETQEQAFARRR